MLAFSGILCSLKMFEEMILERTPITKDEHLVDFSDESVSLCHDCLCGIAPAIGQVYIQ